jgi:peptidyl-prolyl cis-trans isomerase C
MTKSLGSLVVLSFVGVMTACSKPAASTAGTDLLGPTQVATLNGKRIPESVFRLQTIATAHKNADDLTPEERKAVLDDLVGLYLLGDEARAQGLLTERTVAAQVELARIQLEARLMATRFLEKNAATDAEMKAVYDQNLPRLGGQQQFRAKNILVNTKEEADTVIKQLQQGKKFADLAKERANGPTGPNGGDLGWFTAETMVQPVVEAARAMKVGTFSTEPIKSEFGYHVLLLEDERTQDAPSFDSMRNDLKTAVERDKLQKHIRELIAGAKVVEGSGNGEPSATETTPKQ